MAIRATKAVALALTDNTGDHRITKASVLVLASVAMPSYVTKAAVLVLSQQRCMTHLCQLWKIMRRDGVAYRYTTHNEKMRLFGEEYLPCDSLSSSAFESAIITGSGSGGDVEITGIVSATGLTESDMAMGLLDGANVLVYQVSWNPENPVGSKQLARGIISETKQNGTSYTATMTSAAVLLDQTPMLDLYSPQCRYRVGISPCPANLAAVTHSGTVTAAVAPTIMGNGDIKQFFDSSLYQANGYFDQGFLTWTGGANAGLTSDVKSYSSANGLVTLWLKMPNPIAVGDTYTMSPGCNKSMSDHSTKFGLAAASFGGQPGLPGKDWLQQHG